MTLETLSEWLRCPICLSPLSPADRLVLGCASGHRHDVNRRGYVSLLPPRTRVVGDDAGMIARRASFLSTGHYGPIVSALADLASSGAPEWPRVLDMGCGSGHYLAALMAAVPGARPLAADLSPHAVRAALRAVDGADGLVCDVWRPLPVRDASTDVLLTVFAPRNAPEFARVLRAGGRYVAVVPTARHLAQLRSRTLDVPDGKRDDLVSALQHDGLFSLAAERHVEFDMELDADEVDALVGMGPSAHHGGEDSGPEGITLVTASVDVVAFARR